MACNDVFADPGLVPGPHKPSHDTSAVCDWSRQIAFGICKSRALKEHVPLIDDYPKSHCDRAYRYVPARHPCANLPALPCMLTSLSERLSWPCQSSPMAKLLVGPAGLLSCCDMLPRMSSWKMAAITRSGSWPRFSPSSSTAASALVHYRHASPQHSSPQSTKRAAPLMPPTTGP